MRLHRLLASPASLPASSSLSAQLFTDLHELCVTLRDGSVPVVAWLKNAVSLAGGRAEVVVFEEALAHLGHSVPVRSTAPVRETAPRPAPKAPEDRLDVVILVALHDELEAVLALGEGGRAGWEEKRDLQRFRYFRRRFPREGGRDLVIAAAWIGEMGERAATSRGQQLVQELNPACEGRRTGARGARGVGDGLPRSRRDPDRARCGEARGSRGRSARAHRGRAQGRAQGAPALPKGSQGRSRAADRGRRAGDGQDGARGSRALRAARAAGAEHDRGRHGGHGYRRGGRAARAASDRGQSGLRSRGSREGRPVPRLCLQGFGDVSPRVLAEAPRSRPVERAPSSAADRRLGT